MRLGLLGVHVPNKVLVHGTHELRTYVELYCGAGDLIKKTEKITQGGYYTAMGALILTAFCFEAYLNHLGEAKLDFWSEIETAKVMGKYAVLCDRFDISIDKARRPHQTIGGLFKFRNVLAHGRSQKLQYTGTASEEDDDNPVLLAPWQQYCTLKNAKRAREDVSTAIKTLHFAAGLGSCPFQPAVKVVRKRLVSDGGKPGRPA